MLAGDPRRVHRLRVRKLPPREAEDPIVAKVKEGTETRARQRAFSGSVEVSAVA